MSQTAALFLDAYRALSASKLFWVTLVLSALVAGVVGAIGIDEEGVTILHWHVLPSMTTEEVPRPRFYKSLFVNLGIGVWLTWIATVLALISTAGIFPNLVADGSIGLLLSKPIGRVRLFLTKYATGLLFVALQVVAFTAASFLVLGVRGGAWEPGVFLAVPIVVVFFSYLFGVCCLLGVLTRSTIAALLLTLLFWFGLFLVNAADQTIHTGRAHAEARLERVEGRETEAEVRETLETWRTAEAIVLGIKTFVPKTDGTIRLLEESLIDLAELPDASEEARAAPGPGSRGARVQRRIAEERRDRSTAWVLGTSLAFEAVMVALAAWLFWRRDF